MMLEELQRRNYSAITTRNDLRHYISPARIARSFWGTELLRWQGELVERSFAHAYETVECGGFNCADAIKFSCTTG